MALSIGQKLRVFHDALWFPNQPQVVLKEGYVYGEVVKLENNEGWLSLKVEKNPLFGGGTMDIRVHAEDCEIV